MASPHTILKSPHTTLLRLIQYPAVILPLLNGPRMLMNRNLLYTAVTRARSCVTVVGSPYAFNQMIDNKYEQMRYTSLKQRICELES
mgnify:CR=1 FL=1